MNTKHNAAILKAIVALRKAETACRELCNHHSGKCDCPTCFNTAGVIWPLSVAADSLECQVIMDPPTLQTIKSLRLAACS
jgi:hypothetical protein